MTDKADHARSVQAYDTYQSRLGNLSDREEAAINRAFMAGWKSATETKAPWDRPELEGWDIVGMNHYHQAGVRMLFIAMTKRGLAIQVDGRADAGADLWGRLAREAQSVKGLRSTKDAE